MLREALIQTNVLPIISLLMLVVLMAIPQVANSEELSDADLFAAVNKQTNTFSRVRKLYVFPPGRNKRITFVRTDTHKLYIIDTAEDLVFYVSAGIGIPEKAKRKMDAYRAEFAHVVKSTVQDAVRNHDDKMRAKVVEIFTPKVANIQPKTISDPPPPTLDSYHISYAALKGKHNFPSDLPLTAKVIVGDNTYSLKTTLQYYSLPNMRVITN
ncbi:hypothetical protein C5Y96_21945 [Blastopirellula marina]|uniref:Uncharacterized protein n=1 Tax=Blastopirellula marina TaxID=124 RepID=A0A2S8F1Q8_9BACT|nr:MULTISPECIES: hypothetical protein [Pirellulaceae]PQO26115.1 hypothetical protein C5Y96_21945 [Blastopirellula marina]RCS44473.1 hypothetical protein DTL36_21990 [Bremerella cremea]